MEYPYNGVYDSAIISNKVLKQAKTRMNHENKLSEEAKHKWPHIVIFLLYKMYRTDKSLELESRIVVARV